jgi:hypothetical protein
MSVRGQQGMASSSGCASSSGLTRARRACACGGARHCQWATATLPHRLDTSSDKPGTFQSAVRLDSFAVKAAAYVAFVCTCALRSVKPLTFSCLCSSSRKLSGLHQPVILLDHPCLLASVFYLHATTVSSSFLVASSFCESRRYNGTENSTGRDSCFPNHFSWKQTNVNLISMAASHYVGPTESSSQLLHHIMSWLPTCHSMTAKLAT